MSHYCEKCGKTMNDDQFYTSKNIAKYPPDGRLNQCKKCLTMLVDNWDPETYTWILKEIDVPYVKEVWDTLLTKHINDGRKLTGTTILGKYLSTMKLKQWKEYHWEDGPRLEEKAREEKATHMRAQGYTGEEIEHQLAIDRTPPRPKILTPQITPVVEETDVPLPVAELPEEDSDPIVDSLTDEDKSYLRMKWGRGYRPEEWLKLEQLYDDMMRSYDIQTAGHIDTLIMICKASLKANQLLDCGDIEGFQKMSRAYDTLMKSGKFTAAQNKEEAGEAVDSIGEIVAICETDKFIPRYYVDEPKDKVDRVLQDMQNYTYDLVTEELGLGNLIENSVKALERERATIKAASELGEDEDGENQLFDYSDHELEDKDFREFQDMMDSLEGEEL